MQWVSLAILIVLFTIGRSIEQECINRSCSKFSTNTIGFTTLLIVCAALWFFMDIGWVHTTTPIYPD